MIYSLTDLFPRAVHPADLSVSCACAGKPTTEQRFSVRRNLDVLQTCMYVVQDQKEGLLSRKEMDYHCIEKPYILLLVQY